MDRVFCYGIHDNFLYGSHHLLNEFVFVKIYDHSSLGRITSVGSGKKAMSKGKGFTVKGPVVSHIAIFYVSQHHEQTI